jgi:thiopurine S-methyltransferase
MDRTFWLERWQNHQIGFHQPKVQPALVRHWSTVDVAKGGNVLVPLAGKSLDMSWLAEQGYNVVGVELSEIAVAEFFAERAITPAIKKTGKFTVSAAGPIEIWRGDFFELSAPELPRIDAVYDRAAMVAMPDDMQPRYAAKLAELMPVGARGLLIGLDYDTNEMKGPPFSIPQRDMRNLLGPHFDIDVLEVRDGQTKTDHLAKRGLTRLEEATYVLTRRA